MIEIYQIARVKETFSSTDGFNEIRLKHCFESFRNDIDNGRFHVEDTSWLFLSKDSASDFCKRHNTSYEKLGEYVGKRKVTFEFNVFIPNTVFD